MFRQNHLWLLVASLALAGCLGEESKKVAVGPAQPPTIAEESPETPDPSQPNANTNSPQNETPFPEVEIDTSPVDFGDIPPAPEAYSGQDQDPDTPIPPEVQRTLKSYSDEDIPEQIKLLQYPQANVRVQAIGRFTYIGEEYVPQVVQALRGALKDPNVHVRRAAANAISHHGPKAKDALPELAALIHSKDTDEVDAVMNALARIGPDAAPLVGQLAGLLKQQEYENKGDVIDTLGWIGRGAKPTAPLLVASLDDWLHNDNAGDALARIGAHDELLRAMSHEKSSVRSTAAESAGLLETHSPEMVTRLIKMATTDEYEYARAYAAHTLGKVRPTTKEITLAIGQATKDEDSDVRRGAARGLGETDPKFDEAVPLLLAIAKDEDKWVRESAAAALGTFEASPESRLTVLLDQLQETANFSYSAPAAALKKSCDEFYPLLQAIAEDAEQDEARRGIALLSVMELMENSEFNTDERGEGES